jgi:transketolase
VFAFRRTYDFVSQGIAEEGLNVKICCALPGLTTGYGPSHQATEDVAIFRGIEPPSTRATRTIQHRAGAAHPGPVYMRPLRGNAAGRTTPLPARMGKAKLIRDGKDALVISSGS